MRFSKFRRGRVWNCTRLGTHPTVIVSDGGYGVSGFEGDTVDHLGLPAWYRPHVAAWAQYATQATTLWFWNSEIGWAAVLPVNESQGWRYVNANIWNKGKRHIAGNVNARRIRRFPVVSEICVQYVYEAHLDGLPLKQRLLEEWRRTTLPLYQANVACGVADAGTRKYLTQGHLWYFPSPKMFLWLQEYGNLHGAPEGRPGRPGWSHHLRSRTGARILTARPAHRLAAARGQQPLCSRSDGAGAPAPSGMPTLLMQYRRTRRGPALRPAPARENGIFR